MKNRAILIFAILILPIISNASFSEGEAIFGSKCMPCHGKHLEPKVIKKNFFESNNTLLNMKVPSVNMLSYALIDSPTHIGDSSDAEMQVIEIEEFLKDYLEKPDKTNSVCDPRIMRFYDTKKSMKGQLSDSDYVNLAEFFMGYKKNRMKKHPRKAKVLSDTYGIKELLADAKKENKKIIIEASTKDCYFCKKMKREVLDAPQMQKKIGDDFIFLEIDIDKNKLPFDLKKSFKGVTPTFFFLTKEGKLEMSYPGSWNTKDFHMLLDEHSKGRP